MDIFAFSALFGSKPSTAKEYIQECNCSSVYTTDRKTDRHTYRQTEGGQSLMTLEQSIINRNKKSNESFNRSGDQSDILFAQ